MSREQQLRDEIDSYKDSLYAIVGFMNLYRYDDDAKKMRDDVILFQGRQLSPPEPKTKDQSSPTEPPAYVTPDIGVLLPDESGVLGEVKASFPEDRSLWIRDFQQLMKYDQDLTGWPNSAGRVKTHDVVLLLHYSRSVAVRNFYNDKKGSEINFSRPFCIVEFNRLTQAKEYFSLRIQMGALSQTQVSRRLEEGVQIPMIVYVSAYSACKIYDCLPPMPYLLDLIWSNVVTLKASEDPKFSKLRKNQNLEVEISVSEITEQLYRQFSFYSLHGDQPERQPKVPKQRWVKIACERLVSAGNAVWVGENKDRIRFSFVRYEDVLDYFVKLCAQDPPADSQGELFPESDVILTTTSTETTAEQ
ncbi:MAG: hypothetical protein ACR2H4_00580 [Pyrinomonadaceae bacterium]